MHNLSSAVLTKRLPLDGTTTYTGTAGTTALTTDGVDTRGYNGARFKISFGTITSTAVTSVKVQQSDDDGSSDDYSDIAGSSVTVADTDDNKQVIIDVYKPAKRYLCAVISRGTANAVVDHMEVELYGPNDSVVTQDTTVVSAKILATPAEGTA